MAISRQTPLHDLPDRVLRDSLQHPDNLPTLIGQVVPEQVERFDFPRMRPLEREFPLDDWRRRESDLAFEVPFRISDREEWALVFVLVEHQSGTDLWMPLRLLLAVVLYWERHWKRWEDAAAPKPPVRLPPVLPIVLHTGQRAWDSNRGIADLLAEPAALHAFAPEWQPLFWNLADQTPEQLLASAQEWLQMLAVLRARGEDAERFAAVFTEAVQRLQPLCNKDHRRWYDLLRILMTWVAWRRPREERDVLTTAAVTSQADAVRQREVSDMSQQLGQTLEEWMQEREQNAELRATRRILLGVLRARFGTFPEEMIQRIEANTDLDQLTNVLFQVPLAGRIEDLQI